MQRDKLYTQHQSEDAERVPDAQIHFPAKMEDERWQRACVRGHSTKTCPPPPSSTGFAPQQGGPEDPLAGVSSAAARDWGVY